MSDEADAFGRLFVAWDLAMRRQSSEEGSAPPGAGEYSWHATFDLGTGDAKPYRTWGRYDPDPDLRPGTPRASIFGADYQSVAQEPAVACAAVRLRAEEERFAREEWDFGSVLAAQQRLRKRVAQALLQPTA